MGKRVQFYGVTFLSQVQFSDEGDEALAQRIVKIYVGFFRACVKQVNMTSLAPVLETARYLSMTFKKASGVLLSLASH